MKQEDFPKLRRLLNSLGLDHISDKLVQIDTVKEEMPECWEPASREKMSEEGRVPPGPPGPPGPLQSSAAWPVLLEARVRGRGRPPGRDLAAVVRAGQKRSKACPVCRAVIAGAGTNWRFPLYSHLSRKHFSNVSYYPCSLVLLYLTCVGVIERVWQPRDELQYLWQGGLQHDGPQHPQSVRGTPRRQAQVGKVDSYCHQSGSHHFI